MTPSVPSEPTNSCVRSGPTAARGAPPVVIERAVGEHDVEAGDDVLDLPVAGRELARRRGTRASRRRSRAPSTGASARTSRRARRAARPRTRRRTCPAARRRAATSCRRRRCPASAVRSSSTPPNTGHARAAHAAAAGRGGDRDARVVADAQHRRRPRRPSAGRTTTDARARDLRRRAPTSSRAATSRGWPRRPSARSADTSAPVAAQPRAQRVVDLDPRRRRAGRGRPPARRRTRSAAWARPGSSACGGDYGRGSTAAATSASSAVSGSPPVDALDVDQRPVRRRPGGRARRRSSRARRAMSAATVGGRGRGRVAGEQPGPGAAGEHVVDRAGHLVPRRVDGLGPRVRETGHERLARAPGRRRRARATVAARRCRSARRGAAGRSDASQPVGARAAARAWCGCVPAVAGRALRRPRRPRRRPCAGRS